MKQITVSEEFYNAALELAQYIDNNDSEYDELKIALDEGVPLEDTILYKAALVGGWEDSLTEYVENLNK